jgi:sialidase-1
MWVTRLGLVFLLTVAGALKAAPPAIDILETRFISWKPPLYHGWPTLARRADGELLLGFSGGRESHICPFGRLEWMRSKDNGKNWGWPQVLYDSPIDDRDVGVHETRSGTILVTNFTSLAYKPLLAKAEVAKPGEPGAFKDAKLLDEWRAIDRRTNEEQKQSELGCYLIRSTDGGMTWGSRIKVPVNSPHGPISLKDGRLLYPGVALWEDHRVGLCESKDDGLSWKWLSEIPVRSGDSIKDYHELHGVECSDGTLLCHIRTHSKANHRETLQSESNDGGKSWSVPHPIGVWGLPSHLLRLRSGQLLMSYGHRRAPLGIQVRLSSDQGKTWSEAMLLSQDGTSGDLGYPSTIECDDGTLVTVWYEATKEQPLAQLRQARWRIVEANN